MFLPQRRRRGNLIVGGECSNANSLNPPIFAPSSTDVVCECQPVCQTHRWASPVGLPFSLGIIDYAIMEMVVVAKSYWIDNLKTPNTRMHLHSIHAHGTPCMKPQKLLPGIFDDVVWHINKQVVANHIRLLTFLFNAELLRCFAWTQMRVVSYRVAVANCTSWWQNDALFVGTNCTCSEWAMNYDL